MKIQQQTELGLSHHQAGQLAQAEKIYRQILTEQPDHVDALHLLGMLLGQMGRWDAAVDLLQQAIQLRPEFADAHNNLGFALAGQNRVDEAIASYRQAIRLKPDLAQAHSNLASALKSTGQLDEAVAAYRQAARLLPNDAESQNILASALTDAGQFDPAINACKQAIEIKPDFAEAHNNLGNALRNKRQLDPAIESYRRAIQFKPELIEAQSNLASVLAETGKFDEAIATYRQALSLKPDYAVAHSNLSLLLLYHPDYDSAMIRDELHRWNHQHAEPLKKPIQPHTNDRDSDRPLRIGYVSPDFRDHVVGRNLLPILREHDHRQMEIFLYANLAHPDAMTDKIKRCADTWRPIAGISNTGVADLIRQDRIDILVDLALHTGNNRLLVFAQKPAPIQVTFAGYPGSTGLEAIDYRLTDPYLDPPGSGDQYYSEKSIRLPDSFWCYEPDMEIAVGSLPAQTSGQVTFGCLNNFCKVNHRVVKLWSRVLKTVNASRLIMLCPNGSHRQTLLELFQREGVQPDRVELVTNLPRPKYFEVYHRIDIGLDTFPYNGHTTSLDSLWMGVPVVTSVGQTVVGRAGLSQLSNLGLTELVAKTPEDYVRIVAGLAGDLTSLAKLRGELRARMSASPLMDAPRFARNLESVYRQIWRTYCAAEKAG